MTSRASTSVPRLAHLALLLVLLLPLAACDKASPVAPSGSTIVISANPSFVTSATGTSTITVIARKANGTPVNRGTQVTFTVDIGTIDQSARTDNNGIATATLHGDGRLGKATVMASIGGGTTGGAMVAVTFGNPEKSITLQADPPTIPSAGGSVRLVALVRDAQGQPLA
nr:Ig-like domain-containing protein [Acidobacteriota bacterium]